MATLPRPTATDLAPGRPEPLTRRLNLPKLPAKPSILGAAASTSELDLEPPAPSEKAGGRGGGRGAAHSLAPQLRLPTPRPQHALPARVPSLPRTLLSRPTRLRCSCSAKNWSACLPACPPAPTTSCRSGSRCQFLTPTPSRFRARPAAAALLSRFRLRLPLAAGASPPAAVAERQEGLGARRAWRREAGGGGGALSLLRLRPGLCRVRRGIAGRLDSK